MSIILLYLINYIILSYGATIKMSSDGCCTYPLGSYIQINGGSQIPITGNSRGHLIVVINHLTGNIIKQQSFDTHESHINSAGTLIETFLNENDADNEIIASICRDQCQYTPPINSRFVKIGCKIPGYRSPMLCLTLNKLYYIADWIQYKTSNEGSSLVETFNVPGFPLPDCFPYVIRSAGCCSNGGTYIQLPSNQQIQTGGRGHFIMTFDSRNGNIIDSITADTYGNSQSTSQIDTYLNNNNRYGHLLMIATWDSAEVYDNTITLSNIGCNNTIGHREGYICVTMNSQTNPIPWIWTISEYDINTGIDDSLIILNICVLYPLTGGVSISPTIKTKNPTINPTKLTKHPTKDPTKKPTDYPSKIPTIYPTNNPTIYPTYIPTLNPSKIPTNIPTMYPTTIPTNNPSIYPTNLPTINPTVLTTVNVENTVNNGSPFAQLLGNKTNIVIVGIAGLVLTILCCCFLFMFMYFRKKNKKQELEIQSLKIQSQSTANISTMQELNSIRQDLETKSKMIEMQKRVISNQAHMMQSMPVQNNNNTNLSHLNNIHSMPGGYYNNNNNNYGNNNYNMNGNGYYNEFESNYNEENGEGGGMNTTVLNQGPGDEEYADLPAPPDEIIDANIGTNGNAAYDDDEDDNDEYLEEDYGQTQM